MSHGTDPNLIRIRWVVFTLLSIRIGIVAYIAAWILIREPEPAGSVIIDAEIVKE